jgi:hypothetical protein
MEMTSKCTSRLQAARLLFEPLERRLLRAASSSSPLHLNFYEEQLPRQAGDYIYGLAQFSPLSATDHSRYQASIDWGDGTTTADAKIDDNRDAEDPNAPFDIEGAHDFPADGGYTVIIAATRTDDVTGAIETTSVANDIVVTESGSDFLGADTASSTTCLNPTQGTPASRSNTIDGTFATFTPTLPLGQYHATIDWENGQLSPGVITLAADGKLSISGSHTYSEPGLYFPTIRVSGSDHTFGYGGDMIVVGANPTLDEGGMPVYAAASQRISIADLTGFYDADAPDPGAFSVQIDWGDGTRGPGQVVRNLSDEPNFLSVSGQHIYAVEGSYTITTTATRASATITSSTTATVSRPSSNRGMEDMVLVSAINRIESPIIPLVFQSPPAAQTADMPVTRGQPPPAPLEISSIAERLLKDHDDSDRDLSAANFV